MQPSDRADFAALLMQTSEYYDRKFTPSVVAMYWAGLQDVPMPAFRAALNAHMNAPDAGRFMPKIADIRAAIAAATNDDGRPGAEEAWAMIPRDEASSLVWTEEMAQAWAVALPLICEGDMVAARMAFREVYGRGLAAARASGAPVRWTVSLGHDQSSRERTVLDAAQHGRISIEYARRVVPHIESSPEGLVLIERARQALRIESRA